MNVCEEQREAAICNKLRATLLPILDRIVSKNPNAKYTAWDVLDVAMSQCREGKTVAPTLRMMRRRGMHTMTGQRFLQLLGGAGHDRMLELGQDMVDASCRAGVETGQLNNEVDVGGDEHKIPWHTKKNRYSIGGQRKKGTNVFEGYITSQIVSGNLRLVTGCCPIATGESQAHYLGALIENTRRNGIKIRKMLLDRGFASVDNILEMEKLVVDYIMPLPGNDKLYRIMQEYHDGKGGQVREYTMKNKHGRSATTTLVIVPKKKPGKGNKIQDRYIAFITNIKTKSAKALVRRIPKEYRIRWGIETGYRQVEEIRARTKSPRISARMFLFYFSTSLFNFSLLYKWMYADVVVDEKVLVLFDFVDSLWLYIMYTDRPP